MAPLRVITPVCAQVQIYHLLPYLGESKVVAAAELPMNFKALRQFVKDFKGFSFNFILLWDKTPVYETRHIHLC